MQNEVNTTDKRCGDDDLTNAVLAFWADTALTKTTKVEFDKALEDSKNKVVRPESSWSIVLSIRELELSIEDVARMIRVSTGLLWKLERRLIVAATIPEKFLESLENVLLVGRETIRNYVVQPPLIPANMHFHGSDSLVTARQESFEMAITSDNEVLDTDKHYWSQRESLC